MIAALLVACFVTISASMIGLLYVINRLISMVNEMPKQMNETAQVTASNLSDIVIKSVESVGNTIAISMASTFAAPPVDASQSAGGGIPSHQPLAPFYATSDEDNSDPTDNDRFYGKDAILRQINESWDYDANDPTGLGLSQDPANFGGNN